MDVLECQGFPIQFGTILGSHVLPRGDKTEVLVVASRLAVRGLIFLSEMRSAGFIPFPCVQAHELGQFKEIRYPARFFERLVDFFRRSRHPHIPPILFAQFADLSDGVFQAGGGARHAAIVPNQFAQFPMKRIHGTREPFAFSRRLVR